MKNTTLSGSLPKQNGFARFVHEKARTIVEIIAALFILLFVYTAINKIIAYPTLKLVLKDYPLISNFYEAIAWGLPAVELVTASLLFIPRLKLAGLYASLGLMSAFTVYLGYMLIFTPKLPCTCGGMLQKLSWPQHLIFNLLFILLAASAIRLKTKIGKYR